jgi:hypothetical protein
LHPLTAFHGSGSRPSNPARNDSIARLCGASSILLLNGVRAKFRLARQAGQQLPPRSDIWPEVFRPDPLNRRRVPSWPHHLTLQALPRPLQAPASPRLPEIESSGPFDRAILKDRTEILVRNRPVERLRLRLGRKRANLRLPRCLCLPGMMFTRAGTGVPLRSILEFAFRYPLSYPGISDVKSNPTILPGFGLGRCHVGRLGNRANSGGLCTRLLRPMGLFASANAA